MDYIRVLVLHYTNRDERTVDRLPCPSVGFPAWMPCRWTAFPATVQSWIDGSFAVTVLSAAAVISSTTGNSVSIPVWLDFGFPLLRLDKSVFSKCTEKTKRWNCRMLQNLCTCGFQLCYSVFLTEFVQAGTIFISLWSGSFPDTRKRQRSLCAFTDRFCPCCETVAYSSDISGAPVSCGSHL